jgi:hypothetical protein
MLKAMPKKRCTASSLKRYSKRTEYRIKSFLGEFNNERGN